MEKVLQLVFKKADGSKKVFSVTDPRDDVTADEAKTAMETVIAADIFAAENPDISILELQTMNI